MLRSGAKSRLPFLLPVLLPPVLFVVLYAPSLDYDFVWTDRGEVQRGLLIRPPGHIAGAFREPMIPALEAHYRGATQSYYRPMQVVALSLIDDALGREPRSFRSLNLLLGAGTCALLGGLATLLLRSPGAGLLAAAVYAAHPANLENYVWIAGLSHALAAFFLAGSLLAGFATLRAERPADRTLGALASLLALLAALLSKENAVAGPCLFLAGALSLAVSGRREAGGAVGLGLTPLESRAVILFGLQLLLSAGYVFWWRPAILGGAIAGVPPAGGSSGVHLLTSVASWPQSMAWLLFPWSSNTSDVVALVESPSDPRFLLGLGLATGSLLAWLVAMTRRAELVALGLAWVWIAFAPTSGIVPLTHMRGERYLALSLFGVALLWPALGLRFAPRKLGRRALVVGASLLVLGLAQRTFQRMPDWQSDLTLFASAVDADPFYREGHYELAVAQVQAGRFGEARSTLDTLDRLTAGFEGRSSYLRAGDVADLDCNVNLSLGRLLDNHRYFEGLQADSPVLAENPKLGFCCALSLHAAGKSARALSILAALYELDFPPLRPGVAVESAAIHAYLGQPHRARLWLERVPEGELEDPHLRTRLDDLNEVLAP